MGLKDLKERFPFLTKDPLNKIRNSESFSKARSVLESASKIAKAVNDAGPKPTLRNYMALATIGLAELANRTEVHPDHESGFVYLHLGHFTGTLRRICEKRPGAKRFGSDSQKTVAVELHGEKVLFYRDGGDEHAYYVVRDGEQLQDVLVRHALGRAVWEEYGNWVELIAAPRGKIEIQPWKPKEVETSEQTEEVLKRLRQFHRKGHFRSILFHGAPGAGKTWMVTRLAKELNHPTLYADAAQAQNLHPGSLTFCLNLLCPGTIIIDDLDSMTTGRSLLSSIDRIRESPSSKAFLATANNTNILRAAVVRVGRFDDLVEVGKVLSPGERFPGLPKSIAEEVEEWPVAFLEDLNRRLESVVAEGATQEERDQLLQVEMDSLRPRVERNQKYLKQRLRYGEVQGLYGDSDEDPHGESGEYYADGSEVPSGG
jgi:hypothetical protein